jgi:hypothetical protein
MGILPQQGKIVVWTTEYRGRVYEYVEIVQVVELWNVNVRTRNELPSQREDTGWYIERMVRMAMAVKHVY